MGTIAPMEAVDVVPPASPPEEGLSVEARRRLERPRGWWARHPWVTDSLVAIVYAVLASVTFLYAEIVDLILDPPSAVVPMLFLAGNVVAVLLRRRWTVTMSLVVWALALLMLFHNGSPDPFAVPVMTFSLAVHRTGWIALWYFLLAAVTLSIGPFLPGTPIDTTEEQVFVSVVLFAGALIGLLAGVAARGRRLYVAALVDQTAQLEREKRIVAELGAERERTRIAREMHDIVSHTLTVVVTLADGAVAAKEESAARGAMAAAAQAARGALADLRRLLGALRDDSAAAYAPQIDSASISDAVDRFVRAGLPVHLDVRGESTGDAVARLAVLRVVQEGLTNALRYSVRPQRVEVRIENDTDGTRVRVENDGAVVGAESVGAGQGLLGVRERVTILGGRMHAGPDGDGLWVLEAWIPATAPDRQEREAQHG